MNDTQEFVVHLTHWDILRITIAARTARSAEEEAERLWLNGEREEFKHCDSGIDYIEAEEVKP